MTKQRTKADLFAEHPDIMICADFALNSSMMPSRESFKRALEGINLQASEGEITAAIKAAEERRFAALTLQVA